MKNTVLLLLLLFATGAIAQELEIEQMTEPPVNNTNLDVLPEFPGGMAEFYKYVSENFKPTQNGKMIVQFIVEKDGTLSDIEILKGLNNKSNKRLIKLLKDGPKWKPGSQNNKVVRTSFMLPVNINMKG